MYNNQENGFETSLRTIAMPADANPNGDIFGGWILSQMDIAGGIFSAKISKTRVTTVAIDAMTFHSPIFVGDEVSCYCRLEKIGRTSMTVVVESWARTRICDEERKVTEGKFTYVAIDNDRKPIPVKRDAQ